MTNEELRELTLAFTEAFNRDDLDGVMRYFAEDAVYNEFNGKESRGLAAIRATFEPQFRGEFGTIRFETEDVFADGETGRALVGWVCRVTREGKSRGWRGLDVLHFRAGKIVVKETYAKAERPLVGKE
jgi:uncharacterized protein (TIGR02246 family)